MNDFTRFLNSLKTRDNQSLIEAIQNGFIACFEGVITTENFISIDRNLDGYTPVLCDSDGNIIQYGFPYPTKEYALQDAKMWAIEEGYEFRANRKLIPA